MVPRLARLAKHAPSNSTPASSVWITDQLLRDSFDRFTSALLLARPLSAHTCLRHASNIPPPLKPRPRLATRSLNNFSQTCRPHLSWASLEHPSLATNTAHLPFDPLFSRSTWQPPTLPPPPFHPPAASKILPHPVYAPPSPPYETTNLPSSLSSPFPSTPACLAVRQYDTKYLAFCDTLDQVRQIHTHLANVVLDAPKCSSLAFDRLLDLKSDQNLDLKAHPSVTLTDLLYFLLDPQLEHTQGANFSKLLPHICATSCSDIERALVRNIIQRNLALASFSAQTWATLHRHLPLLRHVLGNDVGHFSFDNLSDRVLNAFIRKTLLWGREQPVAPTAMELENMIELASTISDVQLLAKSVPFIMRKISFSLEAGSLSLDRLPALLNRFRPLVATAKNLLRSSSILNTIKKFWRYEEVHRILPEDQRVSLFCSILTLVNTLPVLQSTVKAASDLLQTGTVELDFSASGQANEELQDSLTQSSLNFLFFDKLRLDFSGLRTIDTSSFQDHKSTIATFIRTLPHDRVASWISQSSNILIKKVQEAKSEENLALLNGWLVAVFKSGIIPTNTNTSVWTILLEQLSEVVQPADITEYFRLLHTDVVCRVLIRFWMKRDFEAQASTGNPSSMYHSPEIRVGDLSDQKAPIRFVAFTKNLQYQHESLDPSLLELTQRSALSLPSEEPSSDDKDFSQVILPPSAPPQALDYLTVQKLYKAYAQVTAESLEIVYEFCKLQRIPNERLDEASAQPYICVLKAFQVLRMAAAPPIHHLTTIVHLINRPVAFELLAEHVLYGLRRQTTATLRRLIRDHAFQHYMNKPDRVLKLKSKLYDSENETLIAGLISSPNARASPQVIFGLVDKHDPRKLQGRWRKRLAQERANRMLDIALLFAEAPRFKKGLLGWRCVMRCLRYLETLERRHGARLDKRISKALIVSGVIGPITDRSISRGRVPREILDVCYRVISRVEGPDVALAVLRTVHMWEKVVA